MVTAGVLNAFAIVDHYGVHTRADMRITGVLCVRRWLNAPYPTYEGIPRHTKWMSRERVFRYTAVSAHAQVYSMRVCAVQLRRLPRQIPRGRATDVASVSVEHTS
jgi:hypothetical protein